MTIINTSKTENGNYTVQQYGFTAGKWQTSTTSSMSPAVFTETSKNTINTPNFRNHKRPVHLPMNPYTFTKSISKPNNGWFVQYSAELFEGRPRYRTTHSGMVGNATSYPGTVGIPAAELAAIDRKLVNDLLLKIKDQKVNLWQAYAERAKTAEMLAKSFTRLFDTLRYLKRGDLVKASQAIGVKVGNNRQFQNLYKRNQQKAVASGWLELQYGWRPLISDIHGAAEALAEAHHGIPKERVSLTRHVSGGRMTPTTTPNTTYSYKDVETWEAYVKYVCYFTAGNQELKTLSELGITNPALIAWELMPWSFVIDWCLPIGDYISSWDATLGLQFKSGCKTVFRKEEVTRFITHGPGDGLGGTRSGHSRASRETISMVRTKLNTFPSALIPGFENPFQITRMLNSMALLRSLK